jgi:hypothetical protein
MRSRRWFCVSIFSSFLVYRLSKSDKQREPIRDGKSGDEQYGACPQEKPHEIHSLNLSFLSRTITIRHFGLFLKKRNRAVSQSYQKCIMIRDVYKVDNVPITPKIKKGQGQSALPFLEPRGGYSIFISFMEVTLIMPPSFMPFTSTETPLVFLVFLTILAAMSLPFLSNL